MTKFIVELTSSNRAAPEQIEVMASTPGDAIERVLSSVYINDMLEPYTTEPTYGGWSRITVSVDGRYENGKWVSATEED